MEIEKAVTIGNVTYLIQRTYVGTCTKAELIRNGVREKAKAAEVDRSAGVPLSRLRRPDWDLQQLSELGLSTEAEGGIWQRVWSEEEKLNFASTPMFLVRGKKDL